MKRIFSLQTVTTYAVFLLLSICIHLLSCKKPKTGQEEQQTALLLTSSKAMYYPFEVGEFKLKGVTTLPDSIKGTISGQPITLYKADSLFVCLMPDLTAGKYSLKAIVNGKNTETAFDMQTITNIVDADLYVKNYFDRSTATTNLILKIADSLPVPSSASTLREDVNRIIAYNNNLKMQFQSLTQSEKEKLAKFLTVNGAAMRGLDSITASLSRHKTILARTTSVSDYEREVEELMADYTKAVIELGFSVREVAKRLVLVAVSSLFGPVGTAIGTGIVIGEYLSNLQAVVAAQEKLLNTALKPFEQLNSNRMMGGVNSKATANVFKTGVPQVLNVTMKYRTVSNDDLKSNASVIFTFVSKCVELRKIYYDFVNILPASIKPSFVCTDINSLTAYSSLLREVHSNYLDISNIGNSKVTFQKQRLTDGSLSVTFSTTETTNQSFSYDLEYVNEKFSNKIKSTINAVVEPLSDSTEIYKNHLFGRWKAVIRDVNTDGLIYTDYVRIDATGYWVYQREQTNGSIAVYDPNYGPFSFSVIGNSATGYRFNVTSQTSGRLSYPVNQMIASGTLYRHYFTRL